MFNLNPRWAQRGIVAPFVRRPRRRCRTQPSGYYTNMVQQIEFISRTNIQPLPAMFLPKAKVICQRSKHKVKDSNKFC